MLPKITRRSILKFIGLFSFSSLFRPFKTIETLAKDENTARIILAHGSESHGIPFVLHCENPFEAKPPVITYWEYFRDYQVIALGKAPDHLEGGYCANAASAVCLAHW